MKAPSMHDPFVGGESSQAQSSEVSQVELIRQEEKQPVHDKWWIISIFAASVPLGLTLSASFTPLGELLKQDVEWSPPITDEDLVLLDGAVVAPSVILPVLIGMALDAAWSVNLGLIMCLVGSVVAEFFVAMGIAWHSFGLALTGRVIAGFCFGSIFVVADTIAAQFNRRRRASTFGAIGALQALALYFNTNTMNTFTIRSLDSDYEKMNDVLLISTLICLGIGFLWTPIVSSYDLGDAPKRRFWKWHVPLSIWAMVGAQLITSVYHKAVFVSQTAINWELASVVILGPLLGYYMDLSGKSQGGSLSVTRYLLVAATLVLVGHLITRMAGYEWGGSVAGIGLGVMYMLIRSTIPQIATRDNLSTSFGLIEGAVFLSTVWMTATTQTFLSALIWIVVQMLLFVYVLYKVSEKWESLKRSRPTGGSRVEEGGAGRFGELSEPLHPRGA
jgi:MFS family permease